MCLGGFLFVCGVVLCCFCVCVCVCVCVLISMCVCMFVCVVYDCVQVFELKYDEK